MALDPVDRVREEYDRAEVAARLGRPGDEVELWDVERRAIEGRIAPGAQVLDVGCGEGREAIALLRLGVRVVAGDLSQAMLDRARARNGVVEAPAPSGVEARLVRFDARRLPFRSDAFDAAVLTNMLLQFVWPRAGRVEALREVRRVLRPGGVALLHLFVMPLAEDLLGCRAPRPVRRALRLLFGAGVLTANVLTDLARRLLRTRLEPGDRWSGRGVLAFFHQYSRRGLEEDARAAGLRPGPWTCEGLAAGTLSEAWTGQGAVLVAGKA